MSEASSTFDRDAAITRSLLGWGVVAGPFYIVVGVVLALTRPDFDLTRHALSLLTLGEHGWMQRANLLLSALMVLAAAYGIVRAVRSGRGLAIGVPTGVYGACLILSAIFLPEPAAGFPPGQTADSGSASGILHLLWGALGFACLAVAAFAYARWASGRRDAPQTRIGAGCGIVVVVGFIGGAALSSLPAGVLLLWVAVLAGWLWLALACVRLYTLVPHPDIAERDEAAESG